MVVSIDGIAKLNDFGHAVLVEYTLGFSNTSNLGGGTLRWMVNIPPTCPYPLYFTVNPM